MSGDKHPVIIVGAGPVGLYIGNALALANIKFVLLEKKASVVNYSGELIFTWPQTVRLLDQIGLYESLKRASVPIHAKNRVFGDDGRLLTTCHFWDSMITK